MGQKLGAFLRVLGAGLSPQAFAAQSQQFAAEQAAERAQDVKVDDINIKQLLMTSATLGKAYDAAKAANDTVRMKQIVLDQKSLGEKAANIDPRYRPALQNSWLQGRFDAIDKKGTEKTGVQFTLPGGQQEVTAFQKDRGFTYRNENNELVPLPFGSTKTATKTLTGDLSKSQAGKLKLAGIEGESGVAKLVLNIDEFIKTIASPDFVGGTAGTVVSGIDSALSQLQQLTGNKGYLKEDGTVDYNKLDLSKDSISFLEKSAGQSGLASSQLLQLASIVAISNNPSGRVSDKDLEIAKVILGEESNPKVRAKILGSLQNNIIRNYNIEQRTVARSLGGKFKNLTIDSVRGLAGKVVAKEKETRKSARRKRFEY